MSDLGKAEHNGTFLGWSLSLWGSVSDPSKPAKVYDVPIVDEVLPPAPLDDEDEDDMPTSTEPISMTSASKVLTKPTAHLPGDHGDSEGEAHKPAFPGATPVDDSETPPTPSESTITPANEGFFSNLSKLLYNQAWIFIALGAALLFAVGAGLFFWRRAVRRRTSYDTLPTDDHAMSSLLGRSHQPSRGPRTKELYDAFGEVSDDEDVNEMTSLHHSPDAVGYHSGFLDDDETPTARDEPPRYHDNPSRIELKERASSPASGSASGSGDGSWEHASETR